MFPRGGGLLLFNALRDVARTRRRHMAVDALDPSNMTLDASGTAARARLSLLPAPAQGRVAVVVTFHIIFMK